MFCAVAETRVALVQRSCGYADRPTLSLAEIQQVVRIVREASAQCLVLVDNCYGEFTELGEPCSVRNLCNKCLLPPRPIFVCFHAPLQAHCLLGRQSCQILDPKAAPCSICQVATILSSGKPLACPLQVGADLCMGSLIKTPGGTLATAGGYVAGRADLVAAAGARLTAPGVGLDAGAVPSETLRLMFQGELS